MQVDVQTGASGTYDATMSSELAKSNAPTMFNISGFDQFAKYQKYCEPLQDTEAYKLLTDDGKAYSYTIDGDSFTLPYAAEWYGIIYNKKIINDYASKDYAVIKSADDIKDYKTLKAVAESINEHKDDLGVDGAFATPGLDASDTYRFSAHMGRIPLYYEYKDMNTTFSKTIKGTYLITTRICSISSWRPARLIRAWSARRRTTMSLPNSRSARWRSIRTVSGPTRRSRVTK